MAFETGFQNQLKDPKQKRLLIIAVALFAVTGGAAIWYFVSSPAPVKPPTGPAADGAAKNVSAPPPVAGVKESDLKRIKIDTAILANPVFKDLKTYSRDIPVKVVEKGHPNPFQRPPSSAPLPLTLLPTPTPPKTHPAAGE